MSVGQHDSGRHDSDAITVRRACADCVGLASLAAEAFFFFFQTVATWLLIGVLPLVVPVHPYPSTWAHWKRPRPPCPTRHSTGALPAGGMGKALPPAQ